MNLYLSWLEHSLHKELTEVLY